MTKVGDSRAPTHSDFFGNLSRSAPGGSVATSSGRPTTPGNGNRAPAHPSLSSHSGWAGRRQLTHSHPHSPSPPRWSRPARYQKSCNQGELSSCWRSAGSEEGRAAGREELTAAAARRSAAGGACTLIPLTLSLRLKLNHPFPTLSPFPGPEGGAGEAGKCGGGGGRRKVPAPGQQPAPSNRRLAARIGSLLGAGRAEAEEGCAPPPGARPCPAAVRRLCGSSAGGRGWRGRRWAGGGQERGGWPGTPAGRSPPPRPTPRAPIGLALCQGRACSATGEPHAPRAVGKCRRPGRQPIRTDGDGGRSGGGGGSPGRPHEWRRMAGWGSEAAELREGAPAWLLV